MYKNKKNYTSDLINSYAWDTTTLYLQNFGTNKKYAKQKSINTSYEKKGTNSKEIKDEQCNIFDMASNVYEWSTETCENQFCPLTSRGGKYGDEYSESNRTYRRPDQEVGVWGFRTILYIAV